MCVVRAFAVIRVRVLNALYLSPIGCDYMCVCTRRTTLFIVVVVVVTVAVVYAVVVVAKRSNNILST